MSFENLFIFHFQISVIRYRNKLKQSLNKEAFQRRRKVCEIWGEQAVKHGTWCFGPSESAQIWREHSPLSPLFHRLCKSCCGQYNTVGQTDGRMQQSACSAVVHTSNLIHMSGQVWHIRQIRRHSRWTNDTGAQGKDYVLMHFSILFQ